MFRKYKIFRFDTARDLYIFKLPAGKYLNKKHSIKCNNTTRQLNKYLAASSGYTFFFRREVILKFNFRRDRWNLLLSQAARPPPPTFSDAGWRRGEEGGAALLFFNNLRCFSDSSAPGAREILICNNLDIYFSLGWAAFMKRHYPGTLSNRQKIRLFFATFYLEGNF